MSRLRWFAFVALMAKSGCCLTGCVPCLSCDTIPNILGAAFGAIKSLVGCVACGG